MWFKHMAKVGVTKDPQEAFSHRVPSSFSLTAHPSPNGPRAAYRNTQLK